MSTLLGASAIVLLLLASSYSLARPLWTAPFAWLETPPAAATAPPGNGGPPPVVTILCTFNGIEMPVEDPTHVTVASGPCTLLIRNRSGLDESLTFRITLPDDPETLVYTLPPAQDVYQTVVLKPGEYDVTEDAHPDWRAHITVTR